jgi:cell division septation protein DedD
MSTPERRHFPRTIIERLAYIQIEPNNGGIVLNVSPDGLCFHSIAPVERNDDMRFSILDHNRRIDAKGSLVWTDEASKVAGVRFTTLTSEAREQVDTWIAQPGDPPVEEVGSATVRALPVWGVRPKQQRITSKAGVGLLRLKFQFRLTDFSEGMVTGIAVCLLALCGLLFTYSHRRQLGTSLIRVGERLTATSERVVSPPPATLLAQAPQHEEITGSSAQPQSLPDDPGRSSQPLRKVRLAGGEADQEPDVIQIPIPFQHPQQPPAHAQDGVALAAVNAASLQSTTSGVGQVLPPTTSVAPIPANPAGATNTIARKTEGPDSSNIVHVASAKTPGSPTSADLYFDLGKFKDEHLARSIEDKLMKAGVPASVVQKGHLWTNSYRVLVGPLGSDEDATHAREILTSFGYEPKPFERGSRNFFFSSRVTLNGAFLPQGDITVSWESFVHDARVKFLQGDEVLATADGHWMPSARRYSQDEFVYRKAPNNSKPLLEIHFYGWNRTLVLRNPS